MPIKVKFEDNNTAEENEIALSILANYREGMEKKQSEIDQSEKNNQKEGQSE